MSKLDGTYHVIEENGSRMVFRVESHSKPSQYHTVDLLSRGGLGQCTCAQSQIRCHVAIKGGDGFYDEKSSCRHTKVARQFFLKRLLTHMAKEEQS